MLSGLGFLSGREEVEVWDAERTGPDGTVLCDRKEGFLWVICEASTFLRFDVTSEPRDISLKTPPMSGVPPLPVEPLTGIDGGGGLSKLGSGGGGGGAGDEAAGGVSDKD